MTDLRTAMVDLLEPWPIDTEGGEGTTIGSEAGDIADTILGLLGLADLGTMPTSGIRVDGDDNYSYVER